MIKRLTIFCGSDVGLSPVFAQEARKTGEVLAEQNIGVVYGGAGIGLMGTVANAALQHGGEVIGVIPAFLKTVEIAHPSLTQMIVVDTMHQRKAKMNELSDGAIALPGGFGTMEELFEMLTWSQLGLHDKPVGLLNISGFYSPLMDMIKTMSDQRFLKPTHRNLLLVDEKIESLLEKMKKYKSPDDGKWLQFENRKRADLI
jgi:uncharacterized protein (TIGR00730 family)